MEIFVDKPIAKIDVMLELCFDDGERIEIDIIKGISVKLMKKNGVILSDILTQLESKGYIIHDCNVFVYSSIFKDYFYCEKTPDRIIIPQEGIINNTVHLKIEQNFNEQVDSKKEKTNKRKRKIESKKTMKIREKEPEALISYAVKKLSQARRFRTGFIDENGNWVKYSPEEAASMVNVKKKTLDDYEQQIKKGYYLGFDFNANPDRKSVV